MTRSRWYILNVILREKGKWYAGSNMIRHDKVYILFPLVWQDTRGIIK